MISGKEYSARIASIYMQFELSKKAITIFAESQNLIDAYLKLENDAFRSMMAELSKKHTLLQHIDANAFECRLKAIEDAMRQQLPHTLQEAINRINQNEYILLVAVFESFMKDIHRGVLKHKPILLRADRSIPIGRLLSSGAERVVQEEIEREVGSLDRKKCEEKAEYFESHLGLPWPKEPLLNIICSGIVKRNTLLHENQDIQVTDTDVLFMRLACQVIPWYCVKKGIELYPEAFCE